MTDDSGDDPPKPPEKPDPFAPLPLANLPPVRRRSPLDPPDDAPRKRTPRPAAAAPPDTRPTTAAPAPPDTQPTTAAPAPPDTRPTTAATAPPAAAAPTAAAAPPDTRPTAAATDASDASADIRAASPSTSGAEPGSGTAMSWTDMPSPGASPPSAGMELPRASEAAGAMSWTDMPAPMSGAADTQPTAPPETQPPAPPDGDLPLMPTASTENELRAAVGATPRPDAPARSRRRAPTPVDDDDDGDDGPSKPRSRKMMLVGALTLVVGGGIAAMVILGKVNSERYLITCKADRVVVEQGRSFPPWGESALDGAEWKALKIPPEAPCAPYETENKAELAAHYLDILKDHATTLLTAREVTKIDDAEAQLKQALLVARALQRDDDRIDARDEIERLLGDVVYWRASAKLRSASDALVEAANQFDMASAQRPRHVTDAAAWALYIRKLVEQLRAGPAGASPSTFPPLPPSERPTAPSGVALPVEPGAGSGSAGTAVDPVPPPTADAGVPTGGVLL